MSLPDLVPWILVMAAAASCTSAYAAPTPAERADVRAWVSRNLERGIPFSFIYAGAPASETMRSWKREASAHRLGSSRSARNVTWTDPTTGLRVRLEAIEYSDVPSVSWLVRIANTGKADTPVLENIQALDAAFRGPIGAPYRVHHSLGDSNSADSFKPVTDPLPARGELAFAPVGGRSSDGHMPYFNLQHDGGGVAIAIGWTGQWAAGFRCGDDGAARVMAGLERTHLRLRPGEEIRTPRILLTFWRGSEAMRGNRLLRATLIQHVTPRSKGQVVFTPICGTVAEVDPDGSYEGPHIRVMKPLSELGIEVFWSDMDPQQWYPGGFPGGTGTWEPDLAKYPRGMKPIGDAARAAGLGYLLWFEPERVAGGSQIAREHPEWVAGGSEGGLFRLDVPEARQWITDKVDTQIRLAGLEWVRWDFNIQPLGYWRACDVPDRQGMTEIRHIEGLYAMWDELARRHPGMLMDICASGGRRLDIEMLARGLPLWHSDSQCFGANPEADQLQNAGLYRWLPLHACGNFGLEPDYRFRSAMTTGSVFCLAAHASENAEGVRRSVAIQKKVRPYVLGDFYDTLPHSADPAQWFAYQFHRTDLDAGLLIAFRRPACTEATARLPVRGVNPTARYAVTFENSGQRRTLSGAELASLEVGVSEAPGSEIVFYQREGAAR